MAFYLAIALLSLLSQRVVTGAGHRLRLVEDSGLIQQAKEINPVRMDIKGFSKRALRRAHSFEDRGNVAFAAGDRQLAQKHWEKALSISDLALEAWTRLACAHLNEGDVAEALDMWAQPQNLLRELYVREGGYGPLWELLMGGAQEEALGVWNHGTSLADALPHKLEHDAGQLMYLSKLQLSQTARDRLKDDPQLREVWGTLAGLSAKYKQGAEMLEPQVDRAKRYGNEHGFLTLDTAFAQGWLGGLYGRTWLTPEQLDIAPIPVAEPVVTPRSRADIERLHEQLLRTGVAVIDDVLTPAALHAAREACLRAPVWHEVKPFGYLGAYPTTGLLNAHDVFVRAAVELPVVFERLFSAIETGLADSSSREEETTAPADASAKKVDLDRQVNKVRNDMKSAHRKQDYARAAYLSRELADVFNKLDVLANQPPPPPPKKKKKKVLPSKPQAGKRTEGGNPTNDLQMIWAYSYDNSGMGGTPAGIGIHADDALVNLNLWLTPDESNLDNDPNSSTNGGLVVYTDARPLPGWDQRETLSDEFGERDPEIRFRQEEKYMGQVNVTVPHRQNRLVLFNSELYHRSMQYKFKKGHTNRRINLTFLYGERATKLAERRALEKGELPLYDTPDATQTRRAAGVQDF